MSYTVAHAVILSLVLSVGNTLQSFYQTVDAKCSDLHTVHSYNDNKVATGEWFNQYVSFGEEGDKCAMSHGVERGTTTYADFLFYDKETNRYELYPDDLHYHPERPGTYTTSNGATMFILEAEDTSYAYAIQCLEANGKTEVMVVFATREREMTQKEEDVCQRISAKLAKKKLLPKIYKMSQKGCPPEYKLNVEKEV